MPHRNTLLYLNPDNLKPVWQRLDDRGDLRNRHRIGYWFWEIDAFPTKWRPALDLVDEVWVATDFVGTLVRRATDKPVIKIPHAVDIPPGRQYTRAEFGLPEHRFLFLFTFDFNSFSERKNPRAAIEAFALAFPAARNRAGLVIKCSQGYRYPEQLGELQALAARDPRIVVLDRVLSNADVFGLQRVCDAYVSLHRSEGLGLGMAECMAQGKPVIATAYSGNLEFMTESNSCLVDYALVPVRPASTSTTSRVAVGGSGRRRRRTAHGAARRRSGVPATALGARGSRHGDPLQPSSRGAGHRPAPARARALQRGRDAQSRSIAMA
jgi:glycosyltransferase involved in cell wall biosynthesis